MNAQIWNLLIPLISAVVGGFLALFGNNVQMNKKFKQEKEQSEREYLRKQKEKKLHVYNRILKKNGEVSLITSGIYDFDLVKYRDQIRPLIFENYHLLDKKIQENVREIETIIKVCNIFEEPPNHEETNKCRSYYSKMIKNIESIIINE